MDALALPHGSQSGDFLPLILTCGSAFAGVGLNIKQELYIYMTPIPSLTVSVRSPFYRFFAADYPLLTSIGAVTIRKGVTLAAAPQVFTRGRGVQWL